MWPTRYLLVSVAALTGSCVPAGGGFGPGGGGGYSGGGNGSGGGGSEWPIATADEIDRYVRNGSALIEWYAPDDSFTGVECGYFAGDGSYESFGYAAYRGQAGAYNYDDWYELTGYWSVHGSQLCVDMTWGNGETGTWGCYPAEWSTGDTMLLIDGMTRTVAAEVTTYDGYSEYEYECDL